MCIRDREIYRAYCAKQALDYFTRYRMDIIITDINMPIMNGLEMIAEIKNRWPDCRTIILSGYNDFEYAKTALKYGCDFYILKSDGDVPLIDAVSNLSLIHILRPTFPIAALVLSLKEIATVFKIGPRQINPHRIKIALSIISTGEYLFFLRT